MEHKISSRDPTSGLGPLCILGRTAVEDIPARSSNWSKEVEVWSGRPPGWTRKALGPEPRDYIDRYVEGVEVVDRAGMDVVYGRPGDVLLDSNRPEGAVDANPVEASGESVNLWRVWVSPNCPFALAISQDGENVRRVPRDGSDDKQAVLLAPASSECHKIIARDFLKGVDEEDHDALAAILDGETGAWWQPWFRRIQSVGMSDRWPNQEVLKHARPSLEVGESPKRGRDRT